jgi:hypothetical protein
MKDEIGGTLSRMGMIRNEHKHLFGKPQLKKPFGRQE